MTLSFKNSLRAGVTLMSLLLMVSCGKKSDTATTPSALGGLPTTPGCQAGSTLVNINGQQVCQGAGGTVTSPTYQYNQSLGTTYSSDNYCYRSLTVTNTTQNAKFLKEALGVCDNSITSCSAFSPGRFRVNLISSGGQYAIQFFAYPTSDAPLAQPMPSWSDLLAGSMGYPIYNVGYADYYGTHMPLSLVTSFYPINNSRGFEVRTYGEQTTLANRSLIQVQVAEGKSGDPYFTYGVAYEGTVFMTGTFVRSDNYSYYCGN